MCQLDIHAPLGSFLMHKIHLIWFIMEFNITIFSPLILPLDTILLVVIAVITKEDNTGVGNKPSFHLLSFHF